MEFQKDYTAPGLSKTGVAFLVADVNTQNRKLRKLGAGKVNTAAGKTEVYWDERTRTKGVSFVTT